MLSCEGLISSEMPTISSLAATLDPPRGCEDDFAEYKVSKATLQNIFIYRITFYSVLLGWLRVNYVCKIMLPCMSVPNIIMLCK